MLNLDSFFEQFESDQLDWFTKHPKSVFWLIFLFGFLLAASIFAILFTCCPLTLASLSSGLLLGATLLISMVILSCKIKNQLIARYHADIVTGFYRGNSENNVDDLDEIFTDRHSCLPLPDSETGCFKKRLSCPEYIYNREGYKKSTDFISTDQKKILGHSLSSAYILQDKDTFEMNTDSLLSANKEDWVTKSVEEDGSTLKNTHLLSHFFEKNFQRSLQFNFKFASRDAQRSRDRLKENHANNSGKMIRA